MHPAKSLQFINTAIFGGMQTGLADKLRLASDYMRFRLHARSRYRVHSPFLFELINEVFHDRRHFYAFEEIESIRDHLLSEGTVISENHYGEASKKLPGSSRRLMDVARVTAIPPEYGRLLFRLVNRFQPSGILELGTGIGISTLYLAKASSVPVISLEGSPALSKIAREQAAKMNLNNVQIATGNFSETLPAALQQLKNPGFIFIDGDHRKEALLDYVHQCMKHYSTGTVFMIDDIYWSGGMKEAWTELINLPQVSMSIDLFRMGILFLREGMKKQHLKVVY